MGFEFSGTLGICSRRYLLFEALVSALGPKLKTLDPNMMGSDFSNGIGSEFPLGLEAYSFQVVDGVIFLGMALREWACIDWTPTSERKTKTPSLGMGLGIRV